ncbi:MAG: glycosyltransferase [Bacteroidia bacterium]
MSAPHQRPLLVMATTNDQWQDQRMLRWCQTLQQEGWRVHWFGVDRGRPVPLIDLENVTFQRLRLPILQGPWFYAIYNFLLLFKAWNLKARVYLAVDADTLPALRLVSWLRQKMLWWDAHEWFTEVPELSGRPAVRWVWNVILKVFLRGNVRCFTVGPALAGIFQRTYGYPFTVLRNMPASHHEAVSLPHSPPVDGPFILYQGALNVGRGLEVLIDAAALGLPCPLVLAGGGDLEDKLRNQVQSRGLHDKVFFTGPLPPGRLRTLTKQAWLGMNLLDHPSLSYRYSLANKFFDYTAAGLPQVSMNFPEYQNLLKEYPVGWTLDHCSPEQVVGLCNELWDQPDRVRAAREACPQAAEVWTWENESGALVAALRTLVP